MSSYSIPRLSRLSFLMVGICWKWTSSASHNSYFVLACHITCLCDQLSHRAHVTSCHSLTHAIASAQVHRWNYLVRYIKLWAPSNPLIDTPHQVTCLDELIDTGRWQVLNMNTVIHGLMIHPKYNHRPIKFLQLFKMEKYDNLFKIWSWVSDFWVRYR